MKIALLAPFGVRPKGTVQARMMPLAHTLAERGHAVRVVIPPWDDPVARAMPVRTESIEVARGRGEGAGVHVVTLALPRGRAATFSLTYGLLHEALRPRTRSGGLKSAEEELACFRAQVAHVFKPVGYSGLAGFALSALRLPWALDVDDWEGPGGWADVRPYSAAQKLSLVLMEAALPRLAKQVTAASRALEARAWNMGLPRSRVTYLPNGVLRERYASWHGTTSHLAEQASLRRRLGLERGPVLLLYTRFDVFPVEWPLRILKGVLRRHPGVKMLVVGKGLRGEEARLLAEAHKAGLGQHFVLAGYVPQEQLPAYLGLGDLCIYPMQDTILNRAKSPMKLLEPMVMGLAVVAHRVGEAALYLGDAGLLVKAGDVEGMAAAASRLLSSPGVRTRLGQAAAERVWSRHDWAVLSGRAEAAYRSALGIIRSGQQATT